jgi:alpha-tubulin suppressor-like RCC1 family protein
MATKTDGTLWSWGINSAGQCGINDVTYRSSPVQVGSNTNWDQLSTSAGSASIATKTDGTLWTWGSGFAGILGRNNELSASSPTQVGTGTNWFRVGAGNGITAMATKTDGTLWLWGYNNYGQLGQNNTVHRSSPVQLGVATNWSQISVGRYCVMATKTDGTLWMWGGNDRGQLGQNNVILRSSPTQVGSATNWNLVSIARYNAVATKTDGTLWTWGGNENGQLGQNNVILRSSPVQIGTGTNWNLISTTHYSNFAFTRN